MNDAVWIPLADRFRAKVAAYRKAGKRLFASSSFQTHSIPMLHLISRFAPEIPVYFLDTGFHFPETKRFRDQVAGMLGLKLISIESPVPKLAQRDSHGMFLFASDPDRCCYLNKVLPLEPVLREHDVWVAGLRKDQTRFRRDLLEEVPGQYGTLKYHPMLEWNSKMVWDYRKRYDLPENPLEARGYLSIGCSPCTRRWDESASKRGGRWAGTAKEECGIHTEFVHTQ
jgi:phosphoadenosine phosphosulfate reductase